MIKKETYNLKGDKEGTISLPENIFGVKVNDSLLSQVIRFYLFNKTQGTVSTKTRGEVSGGGKKIWAQKGTGHARQGSIRAPHWRKGGIVFGPKPYDASLRLPEKMKRLALLNALTARLSQDEIKIVSGLEQIEPKTKVFNKFINSLWNDRGSKQYSLLVVLPKRLKNTELALRNIEGVNFRTVDLLSADDVLRSKKVILMAEAVKTLEERFAE